MTILNFTVDFGLKKLLDGTKTRTMRPVRENPNSVWNRLYAKWQSNFEYKVDGTIYPDPNTKPIFLQIWWRQRSRNYQCGICLQDHRGWNKQITQCPSCHSNQALYKEAKKLFDAVLVNMTKRTLGSLTEEEWKADGFEDVEIDYYEVSAKDQGLRWFAKTYGFDLRDENDYISLLNFEIYIIEFQRVEVSE